MGKEFTIEEDIGVGELNPGSTKRRWEPPEGVSRLNERIHKESKWTDNNKKLDFTFSKPKKSSKRTWKRCTNCGKESYIPTNSVGMICSGCKQYASVEEI